MLRASILFIGFCIVPAMAALSLAEARVFDMGKENFGTIIRYSYTPGVVGDTPFASSSGNNMSFNDSYPFINAYEFGFVWNFQYFNLRFQIELTSPTEKRGISGTNSSGTQLYTFASRLSVLTPKIGAEVNMKKWKTSRVFAYADIGNSTLTVQNEYSFTSAGRSQFGLEDFREELKATSIAFYGGLAFETLIADTATLILDVGYNVMNFKSLSHNVASVGFQGAVTQGSPGYNNDGTTARSLSLGGVQAGAALRFWLY